MATGAGSRRGVCDDGGRWQPVRVTWFQWGNLLRHSRQPPRQSLRLRHARAAHTRAHLEAQEAVDLPHPLAVTAREVVVDGDHVHALG